MSYVDVKKLQRHFGTAWIDREIENRARHQATRQRFELQRRAATVARTLALTPRMRRIEFHAPALASFQSASHDDHVKLLFPDGQSRHVTPRSFDPRAATVTIDFALHGAGSASSWAANARAGDALAIGGPRGSHVVPDDFDWYLLVGDESALPAIGRRLEELRKDVPVTTVVAIADRAERQDIATRAAWQPVWLERGEPSADDAERVRRAVAALTVPAGDGHVWVAGEASLARGVRDQLLERGHPREWLRASGYWQRGASDAHVDLDR